MESTSQAQQSAPASFPVPDLKERPRRKKLPLLIKIFGILLVLALILAGAYYFISKQKAPTSVGYTQVWRLVDEKISKSAAIKIYIPKGLSAQQVKDGAAFDPKIDGAWVDQNQGAFNFAGLAFGADKTVAQTDFVEFKPSGELVSDHYYSVKVGLGSGGSLASDFEAVDNPAIQAIFPDNSAEAPENSKITIVFSRPMVPLTTLEATESLPVPVQITPKTDGRFKWISTNTLQFIPTDRLQRSSDYTVTVGDLTSTDGLKVSGKTATFKTRSLRYASESNPDKLVYNQPLRIYFNQPVDLQKTAAEIKLIDSGSQKEVPVIVQYASDAAHSAQQPVMGSGSFSRFAANAFDSIRLGIASIIGIPVLQKPAAVATADANESILEVYAKSDKFGRSKIWDTQVSYQLTINKAYPKEGDINIADSREFDATTTGIVNSWDAQSDRTSYASADMFDPQGKLTVSFYEPINIGASRITSDAGISKIEYAKKCSDDNLSTQDFNCLKVDDPKTLEISFDQNLAPGRQFTVSLDHIVNDKNLVINGGPITRLVKVYPALQFRVGSVGLETVVLCSNDPLQVQEQKDYKTKIVADKDYEIFSWGASWRVDSSDSYKTTPCAIGEFDTVVSAGFMPQTAYQITANATDVFGQGARVSYNTTTGPMDKKEVDIFAMQGTYNVASAAKHLLTIGTRNITYADVDVCKLSAIDFYNEYHSDNSHYPLPSTCVLTAHKRVELPQRYWVYNYFQLDVGEMFSDPIGNYVIAIGNPDYTDYDGKVQHQVNFLTVTNLAAAQKMIDPEQNFDYSEDQTALNASQLDQLQNLYWVTDITSQEGVNGATVSLYDNSGAMVESGQTNSQGVCLLKPRPGIKAAVVQAGNDSTVIGGGEDSLNWAESAANMKKAYIYTDRPIYRPGDTVDIKGILRLGYDGNYQAWPSTQVSLEGKDAQDDVFWQKNVMLDNFGAFGDNVTLDAKAPLGTYQVCVAKTYQCGSFVVQEYAPAAFQVTAKSDKDEYISKDTAKINVAANYYFGVPVANASVEYTLSAQNYYFEKMPDGWYDTGFYEECATGYCYGDQFISRGTATLDASGKAMITQSLDLQKLFPDAGDGKFRNSRIIVLDATVKNSLGQTISAQSSFIVHAGEFYLGTQADPSFVQEKQNITLSAKSVDPAGKPKDAGSVSAQAFIVDWVNARRQDATGGFSYDWTKTRNSVKTVSLARNGVGSYSSALQLDKAGEYEIDVISTDSKGNPVMSRSYVYVTGEGFASVQPYNDTTLTLTAGHKDLKAGDKGEFVIASPYQHAKALVALERGKLFDYQIIDINGNLASYQFDVKPEYAPNIFASVLLQSADPEVKFGSIEYTVDAAGHKINVSVIPDKKNYQPGDMATLSFVTTDNNNAPVPAQLSVAVADLSVLALEGNPKKDPLVFFYDGLPLTVKTSSNINNILKEVQPANETKGGSGGGGSDSKVRGDFKQTAYWQGSVTTDSSGKATVSFKLPDNLTTWQAESVGVTQDTKVGVGYAQFQTQKDLMVVPQKPRFVIPGDTLSLAAQVFNQSAQKQDVTVSFSSDTLRFLDKDTSKKVSIKPGDNATVYVNVMAPANMVLGTHAFTVRAEGQNASDAVAQTIPIKPNLTYEATATANYTTADRATEEVLIPDNVELSMGQLTINSSATLAVFLSNSLQYLIGYPYGCTEQLSSQLKSLAVVKSGLNVPNLADKFNLKITDKNGNKVSLDDLISQGLAKVYANQDNSGCFGMWNKQYPSYYMTLSAVEAFNSLKAAGVAVNDSVYQQAVDCLYRKYTNTDDRYNFGNAGIVEGAAVLLGTPAYKNNDIVRNAVLTIASNLKATDDTLDNKTLAQLGLVLNNYGFDKTVTGRINGLLDNRIEIDSRGAFLQRKDSNASWNFFETTIADTAVYLRSLAAGNRETSFNDKVVRWLLNSRDQDGAWGSTQNTSEVVQAFVDYLKWKNETNANFSLSVNLNSKNIAAHDFNAKTILDQVSSTVPIKDLTIGLNSVSFNKTEKNPLITNSLYYDMGLKYYINGNVAPRDEGFGVTRAFYASGDTDNVTPLTSAKVGDVIRAHIEVTAGQDRRFVSVEDFIPAGFEIVNTDLATEQQSLRFTEVGVANPILDPDYTQMFDDRALLYKEALPQGVHQYDYYVRALVKGKYFQPPTVASEIYNPENFGRTASNYFEIK